MYFPDTSCICIKMNNRSLPYGAIKEMETRLNEMESSSDLNHDEFVIYLEDMRGPRRMECNNGMDPIWYTAVRRRQRRFEYEEKHRLNMEANMLQTLTLYIYVKPPCTP